MDGGWQVYSAGLSTCFLGVCADTALDHRERYPDCYRGTNRFKTRAKALQSFHSARYSHNGVPGVSFRQR